MGSSTENQEGSSPPLSSFAISGQDLSGTSPGNHSGGQPTSEYYFYQASDGQWLFLHPVNIKCLMQTFGAYTNCPESLHGNVVDVEDCVQGDMTRKRYKHLAHLPNRGTWYLVQNSMECIQGNSFGEWLVVSMWVWRIHGVHWFLCGHQGTFSFVEVDLSHIVPSEHLEPIRQRKELRQKRAKKEKQKQRKQQREASLAEAATRAPTIEEFRNMPVLSSPSIGPSVDPDNPLGLTVPDEDNEEENKGGVSWSSVTKLGFAACKLHKLLLLIFLVKFILLQKGLHKMDSSACSMRLWRLWRIYLFVR